MPKSDPFGDGGASGYGVGTSIQEAIAYQAQHPAPSGYGTFCPTCGLEATSRCKCMVGEDACPNGHRFAPCPVHRVHVPLGDRNTHDGSMDPRGCWCVSAGGLADLVIPRSTIGKALAAVALVSPLLRVAPWPVALGAWAVTRFFEPLR